MPGKLAEIYSYRTMIASLVKRDLRGRYLGSLLGVLWNFISPLAQLLIYSFVFSHVMRAGVEDYYMFLFVALIPWIFFSTSLVSGCGCLLRSADMIKKIYFPREVLPLSYVIMQFINMLLCFVIVFAAMAVGGYAFNPCALIYLPLVMLTEFIVALGFTMILSVLTVYFRDLEHIIQIVCLLWQFVTPVMYDSAMVPEDTRGIFNLNPMTSIIEAYRTILYYGKVPEMASVLRICFIGILVLSIGWFLFDKLQRRCIEVL